MVSRRDRRTKEPRGYVCRWYFHIFHLIGDHERSCHFYEKSSLVKSVDFGNRRQPRDPKLLSEPRHAPSPCGCFENVRAAPTARRAGPPRKASGPSGTRAHPHAAGPLRFLLRQCSDMTNLSYSNRLPVRPSARRSAETFQLSRSGVGTTAEPSPAYATDSGSTSRTAGCFIT